MKRLLKFTLFLAIGLLVFLFVVWRIGAESIKYALSLLFGFQGLLLVLLSLIWFGLGAFKWQLILKKMGQPSSFKEAWPIWLTGSAVDYLTPFAMFGGEFLRVYFIKQRFPRLPIRKNIASVAIDKLLDATVFFIFLLTGLFVFTFYGRFPTSWLGLAILATAAIFLGLLGFFYFKRLKKESALEYVLGLLGFKKEKLMSDSKKGRDIFEAEQTVFHFFSIKNKAFWQALLITFLRYSIHFFRAVLLFLFITGHFAFFKPLAVYGFASLASITPLPATLGALEFGSGFAFHALGFSFSQGAVFSMVWRACDLLFVLLGLVYVVKYSAKIAGNKLLKIFERD